MTKKKTEEQENPLHFLYESLTQRMQELAKNQSKENEESNQNDELALSIDYLTFIRAKLSELSNCLMDEDYLRVAHNLGVLRENISHNIDLKKEQADEE